MRRLRTERQRSLRWRLAGWVAGVMLAAAALVFLVVYLQTGSNLQGQIDLDLHGDVGEMQQALLPDANQPASMVRRDAERYVQAQPLSATSKVLFVLFVGQPPVSNHPELFGGAGANAGETQAEQAAENREGARLRVAHLGFTDDAVPDVGKVRILERRMRLGALSVVIGAGEPLAEVHDAQRSIARAYVLVGALSLLLALLASYLAGAHVTAPLRRMAAVAARVHAGELGPRMAESDRQAAEVRVLADSFNHMLDRLAAAFDGQRKFMADASHELRTPLTVIAGQLEVLAASDAPAPEEVKRVQHVVQAEVNRMARLVDDLLLLTAAEQTDFLRREPIDLAEFVTELWDGLSLTADRRCELGPVPRGVLEADPDRLAQALRNLARNAIDHTTPATGLVRLEVSPRDGGQIAFAVLDDGPGIPPAERDLVFERLYRTDLSRSRVAGGAGLGLSIVRAIAQTHGGDVVAGPGPGGRGARVELVLPGFRASVDDRTGELVTGSNSPRSG